jgi:ribosomal protein L37E
LHICNRCGRKIHGNAFHRHLKVCAKKAAAAIDETDNRRTY